MNKLKKKENEIRSEICNDVESNIIKKQKQID
jgi:hypothetical protein